MAQFIFDRSAQRYRDGKGRFLSQKKVLELTEKAVELAKKDVGTIGDLLVGGKISLATWTEGTAKTLKQMHVQSYLLGRGGQKMMTQRDYGIVSAKLRAEYRYLDQFAKDIKSGKMSEAQFRARLQLYLNNARSTYELARNEGHKQNGFQWERRRLAPVENCNPCINYAEQGWKAIGTLPQIGQQCDCRANCRCTFEYSKEKPDRFILSARFGWLPPQGFAGFRRS